MAKPPLTLDQQADLLLNRGLIGSKEELVTLLGHTNYYKLSGYFYIFQDKSNNNIFQKNTDIQTILNLYYFDNDLRNLILSYLSFLEVSIFSNIAYYFSTKTNSATPYLDNTIFYTNYPTGFTKFQSTVVQAKKRSKNETFVRHHLNQDMPLWVLVEILTWGDIEQLYKGIPKSIQTEIGAVYSISPNSFGSVLGALRILRNKCAHHTRVYNSTSFLRMSLPYPDQNQSLNQDLTSTFQDNKIFIILTILKYFINIIKPNNTFIQDLDKLIVQYHIDVVHMGVIDSTVDWKKHPIWENKP